MINLNKIICNNYIEMSRYAAQIIAKQIKVRPSAVLGLATGSTPVGTYHELIKMNRAGKLDFSKITTFNLDEYYRIEKHNPQSYHYFMHKHLFSHININSGSIHIPDGDVDCADEECRRYDCMIEQAGGIDLQILGLGANGHIGFNEPSSALFSNTHLTPLTIETIQANSRFFANIDDVPKYAITMGMSSILQAKKILLLITGSSKAKIAAEIFKGRITTDIPATLLQLHPDITVIMDREAASCIAQ